ncbi:MAG: hypothetical protein Q7J54_05790 [Candidatus Woesearchaeota archaeon]|nr:hypothetical protein [Candidatus Woesearchaeota archaeon]
MAWYSFILPVLNAALIFLTWVWHFFLVWLGIFGSYFTSFSLIWIGIPVFLSWFFAEFFQEKKGTSLGNAISNGIIPLWVGIDWARTVFVMLESGKILFGIYFFLKLFLAALMFAYGIWIIIEGIKAKKMVHFIGRVRVVTYFALAFTPIFYDKVKPTWQVFLAIFIFFPAFYYLIELIDKITPNPESIKEEAKMEGFEKEELPQMGREKPNMNPLMPTNPYFQHPTQPASMRERLFP